MLTIVKLEKVAIANVLQLKGYPTSRQLFWAVSGRICAVQLHVQKLLYIHCVSKKTSPMFLAITRESIVGFS